MPTITANGTTLYYERRGAGPPLLFISGGPGDAGHWPDVADALADEYTVVSYDRRANSRSSRPGGLPSRLDRRAGGRRRRTARGARPRARRGLRATAPAAMILADLAVRRPDVLRGAVFHEPPYAGITSSGDEVVRRYSSSASVRAWRRAGRRGPWRCSCGGSRGDEVYESFDADLRARMLGERRGPVRDRAGAGHEHHAHLRTDRVRSTCPAPSPRAPRTVIPRRPRHWSGRRRSGSAEGLRVPARRDARGPRADASPTPRARGDLRPILLASRRPRRSRPDSDPGSRFRPCCEGWSAGRTQ